MFQKLMGLLSGKKKKEKDKIQFASFIKEKYTVPERFYGHEPEFIYHKYKIKEKRYYNNSVLRKEIIEIRTVKENFLKEQKEGKLSPAMEFESFYRFIQNLSYHNWSRLQNVFREKYTSYPSIVPFVFHSELTRRYLSKEVRYQYQSQTAIRIQRRKMERENTTVEKIYNELDSVKRELHDSRKLLEKWSEQKKEQEAVKFQRRETVYREGKNGSLEERTILYTTDLKKISKYVMQELNDNLMLERMRRGL